MANSSEDAGDTRRARSDAKRRKQEASSSSSSDEGTSSSEETSTSSAEVDHRKPERSPRGKQSTLTAHEALAALSRLRQAATGWLADTLHACEEDIMKCMLKEHRAIKVAMQQPQQQPQQPPGHAQAAARQQRPSTAVEQEDVHIAQPAQPVPSDAHTSVRKRPSAAVPKASGGKRKGVQKPKRANFTQLQEEVLQQELEKAASSIKPPDYAKLGRLMGFTGDQIKSKMRRMSRDALKSPSRSHPSSTRSQPTPAGTAAAAPSASGRGTGTLSVSPFARRQLAAPVSPAQQPATAAKRALYQPAVQQAALSGAGPSGYAMPMSPLGPGRDGQVNPAPRAQSRKPAVPVRAGQAPGPRIIIHQHTPLRQKVQEVLSLAPGKKGTVGAIVEELQLESPYKEMDGKALKGQVAKLLSSGEEFQNTTTWQSKDNKRFEYVLQPDIAERVKIKGRKER